MKSNKIKVLSDIQHVLERPGMYVGSVDEELGTKYILQNDTMVKKPMLFVPAFLKIFDEIITNSIDEAIRTDFKYANSIRVEVNEDFIEIKDNGRGISSELEDITQLPQSVVAFTKLRAGSNFDKEKFQGIGTFGVGAALTNIFSKEFEVETVHKNILTRLKCKDNLSYIEYKIKDEKYKNGTLVRYKPDYSKFNINDLESHFKIIEKRVWDYAFCFPKIKFYFNKKRIYANTFSQYVEKYTQHTFISEESENVKLAVIYSEDMDNISFVNGIEITRGGNHFELLYQTLILPLRDLIKKRYKVDIKPNDIKNNLKFITIFNINRPKFSSQTKAYLTNHVSEIREIFNEINFKKLVGKIFKTKEIITPLVELHKAKEEIRMKAEIEKVRKKTSKRKIPKLLEANNRNREECVLFICEGLSAVSQAIEVRDSKTQAFLPLKGKVLNVYDETPQKVIKNQELLDIMDAINLHMGQEPDNLRYSKIYIMTDADPDGASITTLLINFFYKYWPTLFKRGIVRVILSPIIIAKKDKKIKRYYNMEDYVSDLDNLHDWKISYNKGLGSLPKEEYKKMITDIKEIKLNLDEDKTKEYLNLIFGNDSNKRKRWLLGG